MFLCVLYISVAISFFRDAPRPNRYSTMTVSYSWVVEAAQPKACAGALPKRAPTNQKRPARSGSAVASPGSRRRRQVSSSSTSRTDTTSPEESSDESPQPLGPRTSKELMREHFRKFLQRADIKELMPKTFKTSDNDWKQAIVINMIC